MIDEDWLKSLKDGDKVAVVTEQFGNIKRVMFTEIHHITPKGKFVVGSGSNSITFNPNGRTPTKHGRMHMGDPSSYLSPRTEDLYIWILRAQILRYKDQITKANLDALPNEKIVELHKYLKYFLGEDWNDIY